MLNVFGFVVSLLKHRPPAHLCKNENTNEHISSMQKHGYLLFLCVYNFPIVFYVSWETEQKLKNQPKNEK